MHYIKKGDRVAILAPTNNAIEQVLIGVIKMTDRAGVDREKILRLGTPSKKFAEMFPEVCEEKSVQKKIYEVDKQINILERMKAYRSKRDLVSQLTHAAEQFDRLEALAQQYRSKQEEISSCRNDFKKKEIEIKLLEEEIAKCDENLAALEKKATSFSHKLVKFFMSSQSTTEQRIEDAKRERFRLKKECEFSKLQLSEVGAKMYSLLKGKEALAKYSAEHTRSLAEQFAPHRELYGIVKNMSMASCSATKKQVIQHVEAIKKQLDIDEHLYAEYGGENLLYIDYELNRNKELRSKLASSSTEERLKTVNVIACTLDGYIGRYTDAKLNVKHIFLDEAGYANMVKALTLFNHSTPISFLGDHKQLPPVCEVNARDIQRDGQLHNMFLWAQSAIFLDTLFINDRDTCKDIYLKNQPFNPQCITPSSLNSTYRFGNSLARLLAGYVYNEDFKSSNPKGETKIMYANAKKEGAELNTRTSAAEVQEVMRIVEDLKQSPDNDFIILTPYVKQVKQLRKRLPQEGRELKILTVHGSQGREWDTVILSVVDTSDKWLADTTNLASKGLNLMNTAVSRARKKLIIVCDTAYWANQNGQLIAGLLKIGEKI